MHLTAVRCIWSSAWATRMLLAVHIGDGILSMPWQLGGFAIMGVLYWIGSLRIRDEEIPRIALLTAVFFVASTIHIPVGPATSVHMLGNALVGVLLGWRAALAISVGLLLQAVLLWHGGFFSLGVNACVQTLPALGAWLLFRALQCVPWRNDAWWRSLLIGVGSMVGLLTFVYAAVLLSTNLLARNVDLDTEPAWNVTFHPGTLATSLGVTLMLVWIERRMKNAPEFALGLLVGELTVVATALLNCVVLLYGSDVSDVSVPALALLVMHLPVAAIEGILVGVTVGYLMRVRPEMFESEPRASGSGALASTPLPDGRGSDS